ncbi:sentrin-specific protease 8-like [Paramacrobiotus metropolitanus]|uniref:sentrin-specific protease 8-like n=1 Tax=Paramacrobiotus metropolitanus TaxID=2943436 RepID=UPI002445BECD|nr:sentrin-specific protease 8-like [Paramacrobiotus metropolitanus]XP_055338395.1 sentrin-specific protease 8-like [Paramacrobiotus metropolitanus]
MSEKPFPNEIILSFFDTLIYRRDVDLLDGKHWINDVIIGFYNEYLEKYVYSENRADICFVHPDVVFACSVSTDAAASDITKDLRLAEKSYVFLPLNNNEHVDAAGGTHWSLLVYNRLENTFFYLDSWMGHSMKTAKEVAAIMEKALGILERPKFQYLDVPQQANGFDCGMYVICFSEALAASYIKGTPQQLEHITPSFVAEKRKKIRDLIWHLRDIF